MPTLIDPSLTYSQVNVAANYLKTTPGFTNFGTRQLTIINVALTGIDTTPTIAGSNLTLATRALQQNAEVYAVGTPTSGNCQFIVAFDTLWDGANSTAIISNGSYDKLEAAINAATGGTSTVTAVAL